jgi:hypothetical protein
MTHHGHNPSAERCADYILRWIRRAVGVERYLLSLFGQLRMAIVQDRRSAAYCRRVLHLPIDPTVTALHGQAFFLARTPDERPRDSGRFHIAFYVAACLHRHPVSLKSILRS